MMNQVKQFGERSLMRQQVKEFLQIKEVKEVMVDNIGRRFVFAPNR